MTMVEIAALMGGGALAVGWAVAVGQGIYMRELQRNNDSMAEHIDDVQWDNHEWHQQYAELANLYGQPPHPPSWGKYTNPHRSNANGKRNRRLFSMGFPVPAPAVPLGGNEPGVDWDRMKELGYRTLEVNDNTEAWVGRSENNEVEIRLKGGVAMALDRDDAHTLIDMILEASHKLEE